MYICTVTIKLIIMTQIQDMTDNQLFEAMVNRFANQYPNAQLSIKWDFERNIVYAYGRQQFCPDGYNLLYNLQRLTKVLDGELR